MSWLENIIPPRIKKGNSQKKTIPDGVWVKCPDCDSVLYREDLDANMQVCPKCQHHLRISARKRAEHLLDDYNFKELAKDVKPEDFLKFKDIKSYPQRINEASISTGESDALILVVGSIMKIKSVVALFEFNLIFLSTILRHILSATEPALRSPNAICLGCASSSFINHLSNSLGLSIIKKLFTS